MFHLDDVTTLYNDTNFEQLTDRPPDLLPTICWI